MLGTSAKGDGVIGQTKFKSTASSNGKAGVFGSDLSTGGNFDAGVKGTSKRGDGVLGTTNGGGPTIAGVVGILGAPSGVEALAEGGVLGDSKNGDGVLGTSGSVNGVVGLSGTSTGIAGLSFNPSATSGHSAQGVVGTDASSDGGQLNIGVLGTSTSGIGVQGTSGSFIGVSAVGGTLQGTALPALSIVANSNGNFATADLIDACAGGSAATCSSGRAVFNVNGFGNVVSSGAGEFGTEIVTPDVFAVNGIGVGDLGVSFGDVDVPGQYLKNGGCVAGCMRPTERSAGRGVQSYSAQSTAPTIEDFGEAQLVAGHAFVALNSDFANAIDQHGYLVFITPEGDSRGLYVTSKTAQGFVVRENDGGVSNLAFDYRIVAKPYGDDSPRLPMVTEPPLHQLFQRHPSRFTHGLDPKIDRGNE